MASEVPFIIRDEGFNFRISVFFLPEHLLNDLWYLVICFQIPRDCNIKNTILKATIAQLLKMLFNKI